MKLRLNLRERLGDKVWTCSIFSIRVLHLMGMLPPSVEQVKATLPHGFKESYPKTYIIDGARKIFVETPNDLQLQSST